MDTDEPGASPVTEDSGSEFQLEEQDEEDEKMMLATAVRLSLQTAAQINEAGPSSGCVSGLSPAVRRRAVAAERRLAARRSRAFGHSTGDELEDLSDVSSEEYPLQSQTKRVVATKKAALKSSDKSDKSYANFMTVQKGKHTASLSARRANKKEERALMQKLRRRLTHVGQLIPLILLQHLCFHRPKERLLLCTETIPS
jgi:DNA repair protein RAD16